MKVVEKIQYQDFIYIEHDDESLEEVWHNTPHDQRWGYDNNPDSEYNKMMELHSKWDFTDYNNPDLPDFWHYIYEVKYFRKSKKSPIEENRKLIKTYSLVEEYYNT